MNDLTKEQRDALAAGVDKVLMPLVRGVLVEKLSQVAAFMRDELQGPALSAFPGAGKWAIDRSTGRPILVYENCSVIEGEQAQYILDLIQRNAGVRGKAE